MYVNFNSSNKEKIQFDLYLQVRKILSGRLKRAVAWELLIDVNKLLSIANRNTTIKNGIIWQGIHIVWRP